MVRRLYGSDDVPKSVTIKIVIYAQDSMVLGSQHSRIRSYDSRILSFLDSRILISQDIRILTLSNNIPS